jgi:phospholipid/cholesterol/gamma-HCH transport system permease protein
VPLSGLEELGDQLSLYARAVAWTPRTVRRYRREIARLLAEVSFGSGALIVILGTAGVMAALSLFVGSLVGLQGFRALDSLGVEALTGFITAYFNTRDIAPLVAAAALTPRSAPASPPSSAPCGSPRRSTRWR